MKRGARAKSGAAIGGIHSTRFQLAHGRPEQGTGQLLIEPVAGEIRSIARLLPIIDLSPFRAPCAQMIEWHSPDGYVDSGVGPRFLGAFGLAKPLVCFTLTALH
jgi:hypothetical protein